MSKPLRIAILANSTGGGGMTQFVLKLLEGLTQYEVSLDLVSDWAEGRPYVKDVPAQVRVIDLNSKADVRTQSAFKLVLPLARYLREEQPDALLSHLTYINVAAVMARAIARVPTYLALIENNPLIRDPKVKNKPPSQLLSLLIRWLYPQADAIVAVSQGMAQSFASELQLPPALIKVIYNPVVSPALQAKVQAEVDHPWFQPNQPPVFLFAGRLTAQKDPLMLLEAFALLRQQRPARLLILGEGALRQPMQVAIAELGLASDVAMPGFDSNPYAYMSRATGFVLSSRWEGLPTVLIEALACGCQVVSTDCPYGPAEILAEGQYGWLTPVGDAQAFAQAMQQLIEKPLNPQELKQRAEEFTVERAASRYLQLVSEKTDR